MATYVDGITAPVLQKQAVAVAAQTSQPTLTQEQRTDIVAAINTGYKQGNVSFAGFSVTDVRDYLFGAKSGKVGLAEAEAVIRASTGMEQTIATKAAGALIDPKRLKPGASNYNLGWGDIPWGIHHLSEHPKGSHYSGDFNIGKFINSVVGVFTFGTAPDFTSFLSELGRGRFDIGQVQFNVPFSGAHINKYTHDWVDLYTGQQLSDDATPLLDSKTFKIIDSVVGGVAGAIVTAGVGSAFFTPTAAAEGTVAAGTATSPALIGVTEASLTSEAGYAFTFGAEGANYAKAGVTAASLTNAGITGGGFLATLGSYAVDFGKFVGGAVVAGYVQKFIGGAQKAVQDIARGNFKEAVDDFVSGVNPGSGPQARPMQASGGYGGGGGGGYGGEYGTTQQQRSLFSTLLPIGLLIGVVVLFTFLYKRKH